VPALVAAGADGFSIQSGDGSFKLRFNAVLQGDARTYLADSDDQGTNAFLIRRARPILTGTLGGRFDFNITPDFGGGAAVVLDAYLDARFAKAFRVRAGKFKAPVGLELLLWDAALPTIERGLPSDLVPNRDVGIVIHGDLGGVLYYHAGLFNGAVDGGSVDGDVSDRKDFVGRLVASPFRKAGPDALKGLRLGIAGTTGKQTGALPAYKTIGQLTFFSYGQGVVADGGRIRVAPQLSFDRGPLRLIGEWVSSQQQVRRSPTETTKARNTAWQGSGSVVLTGEAPADGYVEPARAFNPSVGAWGALEVAARYGELEVDDAVFSAGYSDSAKNARKARSWGLALDWYLSRNLKYVVGFDHTTFAGGAAAGADRTSENALFFRGQVTF
jgi:phosphate-selective porin OprO/OprP